MFRLPSGNLTSSVVLLLRFVYEFFFFVFSNLFSFFRYLLSFAAVCYVSFVVCLVAHRIFSKIIN